MIVTSILFVVLYLLFGLEIHPILGDYIFLICWSFISAIAYISWDMGMRFGNTVTVSTSAMTSPLFSTVITTLGTGQRLSFPILISAVMVVGGSYLAEKSIQD